MQALVNVRILNKTDENLVYIRQYGNRNDRIGIYLPVLGQVHLLNPGRQK